MVKNSIVIADDNRFFADAINDSLTSKGFNIKKVIYTIDELLKMCYYSKFDILLLDVNFNGEDVLEVVPEITATNPDLKIICLTTLTNNYTKQKAFERGVVQLLSKDGELARLPEVLLEVMEKKTETSFKSSKSVVIHNIKLSTKKIEILKTLYTYTHLEENEISEILNISKNTLKSHKKELFELTQTNNTSDLIKFGIRNGLILP